MPWLFKVVLKSYALEQYDDAKPDCKARCRASTKETAALFAAFIARPDSEGNLRGEGPEDEDDLALAALEPGTVQLLEPGEDIKFSAPSAVS